jgi:hypothetical protein
MNYNNNLLNMFMKLCNITGKESKKKQNMEIGNKGTRQEWMEEADDPSQYFTMDYTRVKRRRPIHNKKLPVGP